jgi:hypothetical protein
MIRFWERSLDVVPVNAGRPFIRRPATLCFLCLCPVWAAAAEIVTDDGLALTFGAGGEVISCRIDGRELLRIGVPGGVFVADVKGIPSREDLMAENLDFEDIQAGRPVGWDVGPGWQIDRQVAHSGAASMRVSIPGDIPTRSGSVAIDISVRPNVPYRVDLWLRTEGCHPSFYIEQYDAQGAPHRDYPQIVISHDRENEEWFQLSHSFVTAFFCHKIRLR